MRRKTCSTAELLELLAVLKYQLEQVAAQDSDAGYVATLKGVAERVGELGESIKRNPESSASAGSSGAIFWKIGDECSSIRYPALSEAYVNASEGMDLWTKYMPVLPLGYPIE